MGGDVHAKVVGRLERDAEARAFGVMTTTEWNRVTKFAEKPAEPDPMPGRPGVSLASMGIYVFNTRLLEKLLIEDAAEALPPAPRD